VTLLGRYPAAQNSPSQTLGTWKITIADVDTPQTFVLDVTEKSGASDGR
jgi:hypothetical protein